MVERKFMSNCFDVKKHWLQTCSISSSGCHVICVATSTCWRLEAYQSMLVEISWDTVQGISKEIIFLADWLFALQIFETELHRGIQINVCCYLKCLLQRPPESWFCSWILVISTWTCSCLSGVTGWVCLFWMKLEISLLILALAKAAWPLIRWHLLRYLIFYFVDILLSFMLKSFLFFWVIGSDLWLYKGSSFNHPTIGLPWVNGSLIIHVYKFGLGPIL